MITRNAAQCAKCKAVIESKHRHDFQSCECGAIFVDGGTDYLRFGWKDDGDFINLSQEENDEPA